MSNEISATWTYEDILTDLHGLGDVSVSDTTGIATTIGTTGTTVTNINAPQTTGSSYWEPTKSDNLVFDIDGIEVKFEGREIIRLREMLDRYILENNPEDLI